MPISKINLFCPLQYYLTDNMDARIKSELTKLILQLPVTVLHLHKYHFQLVGFFFWDSRKEAGGQANFSNQTCPSVLRHLIHLMYFQAQQKMVSKFIQWHVIIPTFNMFILSPRDKDPEQSPQIHNFPYHTVLSWGSIFVMT